MTTADNPELTWLYGQRQDPLELLGNIPKHESVSLLHGLSWGTYCFYLSDTVIPQESIFLKGTQLAKAGKDQSQKKVSQTTFYYFLKKKSSKRHQSNVNLLKLPVHMGSSNKKP